jgi:hypothetical protein
MNKDFNMLTKPPFLRGGAAVSAMAGVYSTSGLNTPLHPLERGIARGPGFLSTLFCTCFFNHQAQIFNNNIHNS